MPAARYWRAVGLEAYGGGALELSELQLYDATGRVDAAATLTSTLAPTSGSLAALKDADLATGAAFSAATLRAPGFALVWDFGAGVTKAVTGVRVGSADSAVTHLSLLRLEYLSATGWVAEAFYKPGWPGARTGEDFVLAGYAKAMVDLGPAVYYRMGDLMDASGNGRHGERTGVVVYGGTPLVGGSAASAYLAPGAGVNTADPFGITYSGPWSLVVTAKADAGLVLAGRGADGSGAGWSIGAWVTAAGAVGFNVVISAAAYSATTAAGVHALGAVGRFVFTRNGASLKVYYNGSQVATGVCPAGALRDSTVGLQLGKNNGGGSAAGAWFDEYAWFARELSAAEIATLDGKRNDASGPEAAVQRLRTGGGSLGILTSMSVPAFRVADTGAARVARDTEFGGTGRIWGDTKIKSTPSNLPTRARVVLLHQRSKVVARETWSDPVTGAFAFEGIDTRQEFIALAEDAAGAYRPVAANKLVPEVVS